MAGLSLLRPASGNTYLQLSQDTMVDMVKLGNTGLTVSRIAMGTGTKATNGRDSAQMRVAGLEGFKKQAHHAYERGIRFFDTAETYGSMPYVGESIKTLPRENITILTKMWTQTRNSDPVTSIDDALDRYRQQLQTDYIDILLMHCLQRGDWPVTCKPYMDLFSKAKQAGILKKIGISSHNIDALREASTNPWVDVIMVRVNPFGTNMDGTPDEVKAILATAKANGKGIIGMKIYGEGLHVSDEEREQTYRYAIKEEVVHSMTLGHESIEQMDDAIERVMRIVS